MTYMRLLGTDDVWLESATVISIQAANKGCIVSANGAFHRCDASFDDLVNSLTAVPQDGTEEKTTNPFILSHLKKAPSARLALRLDTICYVTPLTFSSETQNIKTLVSTGAADPIIVGESYKSFTNKIKAVDHRYSFTKFTALEPSDEGLSEIEALVNCLRRPSLRSEMNAEGPCTRLSFGEAASLLVKGDVTETIALLDRRQKLSTTSPLQAVQGTSPFRPRQPR